MNIGINRYDESVCVLSSCSAGRNESFLDKIPFTVLKIREDLYVHVHVKKFELILKNLFAPKVNQRLQLGCSLCSQKFSIFITNFYQILIIIKSLNLLQS